MYQSVIKGQITEMTLGITFFYLINRFKLIIVRKTNVNIELSNVHKKR